MPYKTFCKRVSALVNRTGASAQFSHRDGRHIARCSDGVMIIGNSVCDRVLVKWGSGHTAYANI